MVIYHGGCLDGFGAAWAAREWLSTKGKLRDAQFIAGFYQSDLPNVAEKEVFVVDFSYKRSDMKTLCEHASHITVIDHHISAIKDLEGLDDEIDNLTLHFSGHHSGAVMTWNYFFPDTPPPKLLQLIEDRDLWTWRMSQTKDVTTGLFARGFDFDLWSGVIKAGTQGLDELASLGRVLNEKFDADLARIIKAGKHRLTIAGYDVPAVNAPGMYASEGGNILSAGEPFAAVYQIMDGKLNVSLRARGDEPQAVDVSVIASKFGGGGHKNAAGFVIPFTIGPIEPEC